jgi:pre-mRNA-splicing factor ISY1
MARPAEKARAMLNKWVAMREQGNAPSLSNAPRQQKRPHLASECDHLADAEYYRHQIVREITASISKIQDAGLGDHVLRDLNDEINKRLREKYHWNKRIVQLGGLDYNALERKRQVEEGDPYAAMGMAGTATYRYFGAARDLPGVKEILDKQAQKSMAKRGRNNNVWKYVTPDYFGWRDEEDGVLVELEQQIIQQQQQHNEQEPSKKRKITDPNEPLGDYLDLPSPAQVEEVLLEQKKKAMLAKFSI